MINIRSSKAEVIDYAEEGKSCPRGEGQAQQRAHGSPGQHLWKQFHWPERGHSCGELPLT